MEVSKASAIGEEKARVALQLRADEASEKLVQAEAHLRQREREVSEIVMNMTSMKKELATLQEDKARLIEEGARLTEVYTSAITSREASAADIFRPAVLPGSLLSPPVLVQLQSMVEGFLNELRTSWLQSWQGSSDNFQAALDAIAAVAIGPMGEDGLERMRKNYKEPYPNLEDI